MMTFDRICFSGLIFHHSPKFAMNESYHQTDTQPQYRFKGAFVDVFSLDGDIAVEVVDCEADGFAFNLDDHFVAFFFGGGGGDGVYC